MARARSILELIRDSMLTVLCCLFALHFIGSQARVPSGSMEPTIQIGDRLLISRIPTYYRSPERGDIVVFTHEGTSMIKRVIGCPLDVITLQDGAVYINDEKLDEPYLKEQYRTFAIYDSIVQFPYTVPEGCYFMMGDNRHNSLDSRYWGFVPEDHVVGTPSVVWFSTDKYKSFPSNIRWNRIFKFV